MIRSRFSIRTLSAVGFALFACAAHGQSFRVQCPAGTDLHKAIPSQDPAAVTAATAAGLVYDVVTRPLNTDAASNPTGRLNIKGKLNPTPKMANPGIKCQQVGGGDGFATMGDGTQTYLFSFGPLSGLSNIVKGLPGTVTAAEYLKSNVDAANGPVDADGVLTAVKVGAPDSADYSFNGAIGLVPDVQATEGVTAGNLVGVVGTELTGHVDPRLIMDVGVMNGNIPAPMIAIDEGDELFLTLTNVGMVMRPDLFEQHTVHFHGYPNASAFYDGVPDASVATNVGASFTYYYLAPEAGTYMWHCHISPPEHLQMGMVGQLYVRPRQNGAASVLAAAQAANSAIETKCSNSDLLCSTQTPKVVPATAIQGGHYAYDDGDGSTAYDVEYPIQLMGFDPNFHFVGMTFNPESFADTKDKYFLVNGRSYPDTINPDPLSTQATDGVAHFSQPLATIVNIPCTAPVAGVCSDGRALLRISDLNVSEYHTFASLGIPMHVVGYNARLLRDQDGNNTDYLTNSVSLAGGESADVILSAKGVKPGQKFYLYSTSFDHLSNDAENFGGMMTEVNICSGAVDPDTKACK